MDMWKTKARITDYSCQIKANNYGNLENELTNGKSFTFNHDARPVIAWQTIRQN
jgi:hypothetical protein